MLLELGGDSIGAFVLLPRGGRPKAPGYERTSSERIAKALRHGGMAVDIKVKGARISLSGAQDKTSIALDDNDQPMLPVGDSPSTHILKPDIERIRGVFGSAANETIVMGTARRAGLAVADTFYEPRSRSCVMIASAGQEVMPHLDNTGRDVAASLRKLVLSTTRKSVDRILRQPASTRRVVAGRLT